MERTFNLKTILLLMVVTLTFAIGSGDSWFNPVAVVIIIYYFTFTANLFRKLYKKDNLLTKVFFDFVKMPVYIGGVIVIAIVFIRKSYPGGDFTNAYIIAAIGLAVSLIGMIKRRKTDAIEVK